jgi:hypothetical protein
MPEKEPTRVLRKAPRSNGWGAGWSDGDGEDWSFAITVNATDTIGVSWALIWSAGQRGDGWGPEFSGAFIITFVTNAANEGAAN